MRRFIITLLASGLAFILPHPARAAEKTMEERIIALEDAFGGWTVYGSARFATFYERSNSSLVTDTYGVTKINSTPAITGPDQKQTQWALANNSRFGMAVDKRDSIGGRVELGLKNDGSVGLRLGYGTYAFDDISFLFGQDYAPLSDWDYSNQVFFSDNDLGGWGIIDIDGKRIPQVKMKWKGLQVALVENKDANTLNLPASANATAEVLLPHIEAKYRLDLDKFFGDVFGGAGSYTVKSESLGIDKTVTSYAVGIGGGAKIDPVFTKAMIWFARNSKQLSLTQADAAGATFDLTDDSLIDDRDMGWAIIAGAKIDKVTFEAGYGFVSSDKDMSGAQKDKAQNYYANVSIPVYQNAAKTASFTIVPEAGIYDYMKDSSGNNQGKIAYAGAKWQISF
jgi:hypothetical protein